MSAVLIERLLAVIMLAVAIYAVRKNDRRQRESKGQAVKLEGLGKKDSVFGG